MHNFLFESAFAIPQLEGSTSATAILQLFKEMLLHNCNNVISQSQFCSEVSNFKSAKELHFHNFRFFWLWNPFDSWKKIGGKKSVPLRQVFGFQRNSQFKKMFGWFVKPSWAQEKGLESSRTGSRLRRVEDCGSPILKVHHCRSATYFSLQLHNQFGCPQYCRVAEVRT